jgi:fatty acid desaturase
MGMLAIPAVWTWYVSRGELATTTDAKRWRRLRIAIVAAAAAGFAILALGVMVFALTGYDWLVLGLAWSFGLLYLGWFTPVFRRVRQGTRET